MRPRMGSRLITERRHDDESCFQPQTSEDNNSIGTVDELNHEPVIINQLEKKVESLLPADLIPLNTNDWRVFDEEKIKLVEFVRKKFLIPIHGEEFVKKSIEKKWRDYKCDLKAMYVTKYKMKDALI
ncbi:hypothetical protein H5410_060909 [Solanum commersonii]|uniref:Uncharacterized protein n=1 Tax=Solanum commersonii TaxID=4109 RepID=A0A9J5W723_SOLCO|nr:hypothetical protein H5410_060909 [Solanum commersonii]